MSRFSYQPYASGNLFAQRYHFAQRGDGIGMHQHEPDSGLAHNVLVIRGSIEIYGPGKTWRQVLRTGDLFDLPDPYGEHEIVALEGNTDTIHFYLFGMPADYAKIPLDQLGGEGSRAMAYPLE